MSKLPKVVIIGRTNVGKSTLFNRLSVSSKSLTFDRAGVTRDFIKDLVCWKDRYFDLIDTGGISLRKTQDPLERQVWDRAMKMLEEADLLIFLVDGSVGLLPEDHEIAKVAHKLGKQVILTINKSDTPAFNEHLFTFERLGFDPIIEISAIHGKGIGDLLDAITERIPEKPMPVEETEPQCNVVLLGKPNVGKSSLLNLMLEQERAIVSEQAGTTREPITEKVTFYQEDILITDTPGVRRKRAVDEPLEQMMVKRAFTAMDRANVVLLLIDGSEQSIADQELKLAFYAFENHKALILLINKDDLMDEGKKESLAVSMEPYHFFFDKIPQLFISCKTGKNIGKILPLVQTVWKRYSQRFTDDELTMFFRDALTRKPLYVSGNVLGVRRVEQIATAPITLALWVHEPKWFGPTQLGYFENILRKTYDLKGVPIKFVMRRK